MKNKELNNVKAVFISDVHIGIKYSQQKKLMEFLERTHFDDLYIVGDFIDGWRLKRKWRWQLVDNEIVRLLFSRMTEGTRIHYAIGNHDEFWYHLLQNGEMHFGNLHIRDHFEYDLDGRKFLVLHGHQFDFFTRHASWAFALGDMGYNFLMALNHYIFKVQRMFGLPRWSLSKFAKSKVKDTISQSHRMALKRYAQSKGADGVIYGHTHLPDVRRDPDGFTYLNCGDWVEDTTAMVVTQDNRFQLVDLIGNGEAWEDPYTGDVIEHDHKQAPLPCPIEPELEPMALRSHL